MTPYQWARSPTAPGERSINLCNVLFVLSQPLEAVRFYAGSLE